MWISWSEKERKKKKPCTKSQTHLHLCDFFSSLLAILYPYYTYTCTMYWSTHILQVFYYYVANVLTPQMNRLLYLYACYICAFCAFRSPHIYICSDIIIIIMIYLDWYQPRITKTIEWKERKEKKKKVGKTQKVRKWISLYPSNEKLNENYIFVLFFSISIQKS